MKRRSVARNAADVRSLVASKWTAFVAKHMKSATYDLFVLRPLPLLTSVVKGPAKSTPVTAKARLGCTLSRGNDPIICDIPCGLILAQRTHSRQTLLARSRPLMGQYFSLIEASSNSWPACNNRRCSLSNNNFVNRVPAGSTIGCFLSKVHDECCNRPPTLSTPSSSKNGLNCRILLVDFNLRSSLMWAISFANFSACTPLMMYVCDLYFNRR